MRKYLIPILLLLFSFAAFAQKPNKQPSDPKQEIKAAFDRLIEGIRQLDAEKVMSVYEKSDRILFFNNNGTVTIGWENMLKNRQSLYARTKNVNLEITGLRIEMLSPQSAYLTCKWKQTQEFDGELEFASGRMTLIFKRIGKEWKAVHLHTSPDNPELTRPVFKSERQTQN
ncbi:MAG: nuclear transport factor 2 family protein [Pyrinomonadaceae bacterium]|nr:nuclear transport factor 2 family protein [Pyrinomonadaceae bacterium]MCX7639338.1 nuclear transport factor 2 family protein [Pyrinomonadaceae bacterium]MDW8305246.1 nuclear transport factor 2 family protein [Acidobacteriota bacterium]